MLDPHRFEVRGQIGLGHGRQHCDGVLVALAAADDELVGREVDVLNAEAAALEPPEPGAVEQAGHGAWHALQPLEHRPDLVAGEDDRQPVAALGTHDPVQPGQVDLQHIPVQEQEGAQRLVLGRGGHPVVDGQRGEEAGDLWNTHLGRMALGVEEKKEALCTRICNEARVHAACWRRRVAVARWTLRSRYS